MNIGNFLLESSNLFTVYRWNNNPAIVRFSESDNIYNNLLLSLFVFSDESEEKLVKILHNKIYEAIPKIVLSDISLATKSKIEEKGKKLWDEVINKTYKEVESNFDSNISSKLLIHYTFDEETEKKVRMINLLVAQKEASINERVFPEYYTEPKIKNQTKIKKMDIQDKKEIEELANELLEISTRLVTMIRWNKNHRNIKSSVASHTFFVFLISYLLALKANLQMKEIYDIMIASILHDLPEAFTGDVISPTKRKVSGLEEIIGEIEKDFIKDWYIHKRVLKEKVKKLEKYIYTPFENDYGAYVKTSDLIAALIECSLEISTGNQNKYFINTFKSIKKDILHFSPIDISEIIKEIELSIHP
ncbi:HD domain-containing protein [Petrotoga sp. DB-2]